MSGDYLLSRWRHTSQSTPPFAFSWVKFFTQMLNCSLTRVLGHQWRTYGPGTSVRVPLSGPCFSISPYRLHSKNLCLTVINLLCTFPFTKFILYVRSLSYKQDFKKFKSSLYSPYYAEACNGPISAT